MEKRVHFTQGGEEEIKECEDKGKSIEIGPYTEGDFFMVRRRLQMQQQVSIFRKKCKFHGKICRMIIDSRSFDDLVSYEMVNKLNLTRFPISKSYKASWVSNEKNIVVRELVFADFSIGAYVDRVLCDIIPKTYCHVILGI